MVRLLYPFPYTTSIKASFDCYIFFLNYSVWTCQIASNFASHCVDAPHGQALAWHLHFFTLLAIKMPNYCRLIIPAGSLPGPVPGFLPRFPAGVPASRQVSRRLSPVQPGGKEKWNWVSSWDLESLKTVALLFTFLFFIFLGFYHHHFYLDLLPNLWLLLKIQFQLSVCFKITWFLVHLLEHLFFSLKFRFSFIFLALFSFFIVVILLLLSSLF